MKNLLMRTLVLALLLVLSSITSLSYAADLQDFDKEHDKNHSFKVRYTIDFPQTDLLFSKINGFDIVELRNGCIINVLGNPIIPAKEIAIALPPGIRITSVQLIQGDQIQLPGTYNIVPAQPPQPTTLPSEKQKLIKSQVQIPLLRSLIDTLDPNRNLQHQLKNQHIYYSNEPYPGIIAEFVHQSDLAGQGIAVIHLYPLQYLPLDRHLLFYTNVTIELYGSLGYNCRDYLPLAMQHQFQEKYEQMIKDIVINPTDVLLSTQRGDELIQTSLQDDSYDHVIITSASLEDSWAPLVEWHTRRGLRDTVVTTSYIYSNYAGATNQEKIRNFIIDAHNSWGTMYFLLGGEHETVPLEFRNYYEDTPSDQYYSDFDDDWIHEVFVGRFTADDSTQINTFINKIIEYETNPPLTNYLKDILLIGMDLSIPPLDPLTRDEYMKEDIDSSFIPSGYDITKVYDTYFENHETKALNALDDGQHLVNHADHANAVLLGTGWENHNHEWYIHKDDVNNLINDFKFSILVSLGCNTNEYDYGNPTDSISETFVNYNPNQAGIAFTGSTRKALVYLEDDTPPYYLSTKLDFDWWRALFSHHKYILGETLVDCKHNFGTDPWEPDYGRHCVWTFNLLGEPAMPIWTETPVILNVTYPATLPMGMSEFKVHVKSQGAPLNDSYVCLWKGDEVYLRGYTDQNGDITFYPAPKTIGTLLVTATKHNYLPHQGDAEVEDRSVLLLKGHCYYQNMTPPDNITVEVINLNTSQSWMAETNGNYYQLELLPGQNINESEILRYISKDTINWINVSDYTVTQQDLNAGYIEQDFTLNEYYLDLVDFPMYLAEQNNPKYSVHQLCGAATAQMNLNYMWWNSTENSTPPMTYDNQTWLFETAQQNNSNTSHTYIDADGMHHTLKTQMPMPYEEYGYHFDVYNSTNLTFVLGQICQWIDYPAGRKPGHPLHVPGAVPTFGDYTRWMSIRGIHMNQSAYPVPDKLGVYGFWVNDPYPIGIGENSYKTAEEWNQTYFDPITVTDDPYQGQYVAVCEPPLEIPYNITLLPSPLRYNLTQSPAPRRNSISSNFFRILQEKIIIKAAIDGIQEQLIPYDDLVKQIFSQSYPGKPLYIRHNTNEKEAYYLIPFHTTPQSLLPRNDHQEYNRTTTILVVIIQASTGQFKEASWVNTPVEYLPISEQQALNLVWQELYNLGYSPDELNTREIIVELLYRSHSPYFPEWHISLPRLDLEFYIDQEFNLTK